MSHSAVFLVLLFVFIGASALVAATPPDDHELNDRLVNCDKSLIVFKKAIADYRTCLRSAYGNSSFGDQYWARWPVAVETCKAIEPLISSIKVEEISIEKDDRGPLRFIRPTGSDNNEPFTLVITGRRDGGRDEAAERQLRKTLPHIRVHHGPGVSMIAARVDGYNFSSAGKFHQIRPSSNSCFEIESQSPGTPLEHPTSDMPPVDVVWGDETVVIPEDIRPGDYREYLIFDGKQVDASSNICQISIRSPWMELNAMNGEFWIPDLPLPTTRMCLVHLSFVHRYPTDRSFLPIRSAFYSRANNETYINEFFINVDNPKCVAKFLANRAEVGRCEPRMANETGRVVHDQVEVESEEIQMIQG